MNLLGAHATRVPSWATPPKTRPYHAPASLPKKTAAIADRWEFSGESPKKARASRALPSQSAFSSPHSAIGFTLVELLVSMAILSGLIVLLFAVVDSTTQVWNKSEQRVDAFREARAALFIIARDLQTMVPAPDVNPFDGTADFKFFFVNPDRTRTTDVSFSGVAEDTYGDRLFFLTAQPSSAQNTGAKSDVCSVGYYIDYTGATLTGSQTSMTGAQRTFKLYRYFNGSDATYTALKTYTANPTVPSILMQANSAADEVLARNVVDFRVKAYDKDMKIISPSDSKATPYAVDLSITAYNYSTVNRFLNEAAWIAFKGANPSADALSKQTFATRVYLPRSGPTPTPSPTP